MTGPAEPVDRIGRARAAFTVAQRVDPRTRAAWLRSAADALDKAAGQLIPVAARETNLNSSRLRSELERTTFQIRMFAGMLDTGGYLDVRLDDAAPDWPTGPRPNLRRMLVALGPVVVFAASNFPFAFSVAGGDTASALAAGCSVLVKVHPGHPDLSAAVADVVGAALTAAGAPADLLQLVTGNNAAAAAVADERTAAVSFTGSESVGRMLMDLIARRPDPIPFYGEFGSVNPVFVTPAAAAERADEIAAGFVASFTLGMGQFCTKPGVVFAPAESGFGDAAAAALTGCGPALLLNAHIAAGHARRRAELESDDGVQVLGAVAATGSDVGPVLLETTADHLRENFASLTAEVFGPTALVVTYTVDDDLSELAALFPGQLTMSLHLGSGGDPDGARVLPSLVPRCGRVLVDQWPTGVSVTWAQQHGGPFPATSSALYTSVGSAGIERFLRPVAFQNVPQPLLPPALRDDNPWAVPRTVNGVYQPAGPVTQDTPREDLT